MDPNTQRAEAERWLGIAAKLLTARDFLGSRTFAIRARESDPDNAISDQILAVVDTLLASEKKINNQYDWYSILQLAHLARDPEVIATQYRRLVLLLNPERNGLPFADYAFRVVFDAWSVLSDPTKKWLYDSELSLYLQRLDSHQQHRVDPTQLNTFQFFQQPQQPPPPPPQERLLQPLQPQWQQHQVEERLPHQQQSLQFHGQQQPQHRQPQQNAWLRLQQEHERQQEKPQQPPEQQYQHRQLPQAQQQQQEQQQWEFLQPQHRPPPQPQPEPQRPQQPRQQQIQGNERNQENGPGGSERPTVAVASVSNGNDNANDNVELPSFWTACPYCFYIYEYPEIYMDYTLRCQNCRRAFHGAQIPNPPPIGNASDSGPDSFCCWGYFPLGFSMTKWKNSNQMGNKNGFLNWVPFSPMFACPVNGNGNVAGYYFNAAGGRKTVGRKPPGSAPGPRMYIDDDDIFDGVSESADDSDSSDDWSSRRKNKRKSGRRRGRPKKANVMREKRGNQKLVPEGGVDGGENLQGKSGTQEAAVPLSVAGANADANKKAGSTNSRKLLGKAVKDRGKLDLNVEFSNDVEEHAPTMSAGNGDEEAIEGIGFFEGLDEFLSSLPILNVVGDDKAKPS
ncbi:hypothetical protein Ancab_017506 [Ancistrocladus abbreviatus]